MSDGKEENVDETKKYFDAILDKLPIEGVSDLHTICDCLLCADSENRNTAECYALTDLGHEEPIRNKKMLFSKKTLEVRGAFLPIAISSCKRCRKNYMLVEFLPTSIGILITLAALILLGIRDIREPITRVAPYLPLLVFISAVGFSWLIAILVRRFLLEKKSAETQFDIFKIDRLRMLKLNGWFDLYNSKYTSHLIFKNEMPKQGLFMDYDGKHEEAKVVAFKKPEENLPEE